MRKRSLRLALMGVLLVLVACNTDPNRADQRMGQNYQYWNDYQEIYPYVGPQGGGSWVGSNNGHR
jgi:hypothetical protein